jgi:hypothetical protein
MYFMASAVSKSVRVPTGGIRGDTFETAPEIRLISLLTAGSMFWLSRQRNPNGHRGSNYRGALVGSASDATASGTTEPLLW